MRAKELRERSTEELKQLERTLTDELFHAKFQNYIGRLTDTSQIRKKRRDLARVKTILRERELRGEG